MPDTGFGTEEEKRFERFYALSKFWITLKPILKRVGIGALILFDVITVGWVVVRFVDYGVLNFFSQCSYKARNRANEKSYSNEAWEQ